MEKVVLKQFKVVLKQPSLLVLNNIMYDLSVAALRFIIVTKLKGKCNENQYNIN